MEPGSSVEIAPELRQHVAADLDVPDVFGVLGLFNLGQDRVEGDVDLLVSLRVEADLFRCADHIARLKAPVLARAACGGQLCGLAV